MNLIVANVVAFVVASCVVGAVWTVVSIVAAGSYANMQFFDDWFTITALVAATAFLPAGLLRLLAAKNGGGSYMRACLAGAVIGAALFSALFSGWISDDLIIGLLQLVLYGGLLGAVGGGVFWFTERRLIARHAGPADA